MGKVVPFNRKRRRRSSTRRTSSALPNPHDRRFTSAVAGMWLRALGKGQETLFAWRFYRYIVRTGRKTPAVPRGLSQERAHEIRLAILKFLEPRIGRKTAPVSFVGFQEMGKGRRPVALYNLVKEIPGHPRGSTVSDRTLVEAGFVLPRTAGGQVNPRARSRAESVEIITPDAIVRLRGPVQVRRIGRRRSSKAKRNPPRAGQGGDRRRTLIYPSYRLPHGTTGRGRHVSGGRYYHKGKSGTHTIYGLPGGSIEIKPHRGRLWGY